MDQVYIAPEPKINLDDAEVLENLVTYLAPFAQKQHSDFSEFTTGMKPFVHLLGVYLRMEFALNVLGNYRAVLVEMVEDFEELGNHAVQLSETIKACESILEQITRVAANVFAVDNTVFDTTHYSNIMLEKSTKVLMENEGIELPDEPDIIQLELHL